MTLLRTTLLTSLLVLLLTPQLSPAVVPSAPRLVVIIKFATHPALDETEAGLVEALETATTTFPDLQIRTERLNANGSPQLAKQLAETASRPEVALIVAIATPAAQAVAPTPSSIPLLYGAVADPKGAGLFDTGRATGIRNVGENIIDAALGFIRTAFPQAKRLGTLYNPAEQNSAYVQGLVSRLAPKWGFTLFQTPVNDKSRVATAAEALAQKAEIIYSANDNTVNAAVASVVAVTRATKTPFFIGDLSTLHAGALGAIGLEYRSMGKDLGAMAVAILAGATLQSLPPRDAPPPEIWINDDTVTATGVKLPLAAQVQIKHHVKGPSRAH